MIEQRFKEAALLLVLRGLGEDVVVALIEDHEVVLRNLNARGHCLIQRVQYNTKIEKRFGVKKTRLCRSLDLEFVCVEVEEKIFEVSVFDTERLLTILGEDLDLHVFSVLRFEHVKLITETHFNFILPVY